MHKSYPFLEIVGEAGAGKTTLIEFLWKLVGRNDYEGFDPNKSTLAARARIFSQVSNLPVSLIESDREKDAKQRQYDWDELKTAYNGRASRARGIKNAGNDTDEPLFRGAVLISQNTPVNASEAITTRIIHLMFDCSGHTATSKKAADDLAFLPVEAVSHWLVKAVCAERDILDTLRARMPLHEAALLARPDIKTHRIAKNHAQLMAIVEALATLLGMPTAWRDETLETLRRAAVARQAAIATDHPIVEEFWELIEYLGLNDVNHARKSDEIIAVNLNQIVALATRNGQSLPPTADLKRHLKTSRSHRFLGTRTVNSGLDGFVGRSIRCWCFEPPRRH